MRLLDSPHFSRAVQSTAPLAPPQVVDTMHDLHSATASEAWRGAGHVVTPGISLPPPYTRLLLPTLLRGSNVHISGRVDLNPLS
jgi:hypothetical protein